MSVKLNETQRKYPVHCIELLAIVESLARWRHYLHGIPFTVETDHNPLQFLKKQPKLSPMQVRWMDKINEFELDIKYKPGKDNSLADALSRRPDLALDAFTIASASPSDIEEIKEGYAKDSFFASLFYALNNPDKPVDKSLTTKAKRYRMSDD